MTTINESQICEFRDAAARQVLRGLGRSGVEVVRRARSAHGSDCQTECAEHKPGIIGCRCLRVMRLRVKNSPWPWTTTDWMLLFGDMNEGPTVVLKGPYPETTPLFYGGGFWCKVEV